MKFRIEIKLRTMRALEATVLLGLFIWVACGVFGAWR